ncbi:unnamed protein product [Adineta ricciae]|nr:unnamed protein product [Adineta ricciae]
MIEVKTTDKNRKEIVPILVLCNEIVPDERRSTVLTSTDFEQWTAKDRCFVGNRVWFVNLRDRTRTVDAFTALMKELYKPQTANKEAADRSLLPRLGIGDTLTQFLQRIVHLHRLTMYASEMFYSTLVENAPILSF